MTNNVVPEVASAASAAAAPLASNITATVSEQLLADMLKERKGDRRWTLVKRTMYAASLVLGLVYYIGFMLTTWGYKMTPSRDLVAVIQIKGEIGSGTLASADKIIPVLRKAFEAPNVQAIALQIDSPGGAPVEAERIFNALDSLKKKHPKPVLAFINNIGASAAYMIAIHCDKIYAANYSFVGSIGAVMSGWDLHKVMEKVEVSQRVYASGSLKSMLNPYASMSKEADEKAASLVNKMGQQFAAEVTALRGDKLAANTKFDTGEVWTGIDAKRLGLVDEIGTLDTVIASQYTVKTYDFGPGGNSFPMFGAIAQDVGRGMMSLVVERSWSVR